MVDALFESLGDDRFQPTELSRGPWSPDALHGGPVAALLAGAGEAALDGAAPDAPPLHRARLTIDIERPVPLDVLRVRATVVRPGRKVRVAEVELFDDSGRRLARATLLGIRQEQLDLPTERFAPADPPPPRRDAAGDPEMWLPHPLTAFHKDAVDHRFVLGGILQLGPAQDWIRLRVPVVAGVDPSPLQRVAAAADFGNGLSAVLPQDAWVFINPDLTITLQRAAVGEWVALDAVTRIEPAGVGTAESDLFDDAGRIGQSVQTLLVEAR
ncbi:MAG TPA: thioesterase family protein [Acidimicrobiales bacterium]